MNKLYDEDLQLSWHMNVIKSYETISHVNVASKTKINISETNDVSIIRVSVWHTERQI
jgi:hypothetical protein